MSSDGKTCALCGQTATQRCPTCAQVGLPPAYFCSQACFKKAWPTHKATHALGLSSAQASVASSIVSKASTEPWLVDRPEFVNFEFTGPLRPAKLSPLRPVPAEIGRPDYADHPEGDSRAERENKAMYTITQLDAHGIEMMRQVSRIAADVLAEAGKVVKAGMTTDDVDAIVHDLIIARGAYPSTLNYKKFPKSCCTSLNEVICHGIPDATVIQNGDIFNLDVSVYYKGYHADLNETWLIGDVDDKYKKLVQVTYECLQLAIDSCKPGQLYRNLGEIISKHAHKNGFSVVRAFCAHGIGELFHPAPSIPHYSKNKAIGVMKPGHAFTIEPMINEGVWREKMWPDDWTAATIDGKRSAQFEHTLVITDTGCEVLTKRSRGSFLDRFGDATLK